MKKAGQITTNANTTFYGPGGGGGASWHGLANGVTLGGGGGGGAGAGAGNIVLGLAHGVWQSWEDHEYEGFIGNEYYLAYIIGSLHQLLNERCSNSHILRGFGFLIKIKDCKLELSYIDKIHDIKYDSVFDIDEHLSVYEVFEEKVTNTKLILIMSDWIALELSKLENQYEFTITRKSV